MKRIIKYLTVYYKVHVTIIILLFCISCKNDKKAYSRIPVIDYVDKMKAAWIGQMAGVGWGGPTEWQSIGRIIPQNKIPSWEPSLINQYHQDDLYVEMTFLQTIEKYGMDVSIRQAGIDFANTAFELAMANDAGRENLRNGIAPPESGHPMFSDHSDDIDYQIESDYSGIIAPGMPNIAIDLGNKFGHLMNYGDGVYAGQFIGAMYSAAFFEKDIVTIIRMGLKSIPEKSDYAHCMNDVLKWYGEDPNNWQKTWQLIEDKYRKSNEFQKYAAGNKKAWVEIDAKLNGAYVLLGLLYGKNNPDSTIVITMRAGRDSDCNPSNAAGILFTTKGYSNLPSKYTLALDPNEKFYSTNYNFSELTALCEKLARTNVLSSGGSIGKDNIGKEYFLIPKSKTILKKNEQSYNPGLYNENNRFSKSELDQIRIYPAIVFNPILENLAPGWKIVNCSKSVKPELLEWNGRKNSLVLQPPSDSTRYIIQTRPAIPTNKKTTLRFSVSNEKGKDWMLFISIQWTVKKEILVNDALCKNGWHEVVFDLSAYQGIPNLPIWLEGGKGTGLISKNFWNDIQIKSE